MEEIASALHLFTLEIIFTSCVGPSLTTFVGLVRLIFVLQIILGEVILAFRSLDLSLSLASTVNFEIT
jgi:hypothetical protein